MRTAIAGILILAAGCTPARPDRESSPRRLVMSEPAPIPSPKAHPDPAVSAGQGAPQDYRDLERYSGRYVTLEGVFGHIRGQHGVLKLDSGLLVYIPHFDLFRRGDDWFKYVGYRCVAGGILHTYRRPEIEGYRGPSLEIDYFDGPLR